MITLDKDYFRTFAALTAKITTNELLPVLGYILYERRNGTQTLTKTNLGSYCRYRLQDAEGEDVALLLEEKIVYALAQGKGEISITVEGNIVRLTDGKFKQSFEVYAAEDYPKFVTPDAAEAVALDNYTVGAIGIAANYVENKVKTNLSLVHSNGDVFATDNYSMYHTVAPGPHLILNKEAASIVGTTLDTKYYTNGNIDFFESGRVVYGFTRSDTVTQSPPYARVIQALKREPAFTVQKEDLIRFCEMTKIVHDSNDTPTSTMSNGGLFLLLSYQHDGLNKTNRVEVFAENLYDFPQFNFDPRVMSGALAALPYEKVNLTLDGKNCVITTPEDSNFTGVIHGLNLTPKQ